MRTTGCGSEPTTTHSYRTAGWHQTKRGREIAPVSSVWITSDRSSHTRPMSVMSLPLTRRMHTGSSCRRRSELDDCGAVPQIVRETIRTAWVKGALLVPSSNRTSHPRPRSCRSPISSGVNSCRTEPIRPSPAAATSANRLGIGDIGHALKVRRSAPRLHRFAGGPNRRAMVLLECAYERPWNGPDRELTVRLGIKDHRLTAVAKLLGLAGEVDDDHVLAAPADVGVLAESALQQIITRSAD